MSQLCSRHDTFQCARRSEWSLRETTKGIECEQKRTKSAYMRKHYERAIELRYAGHTYKKIGEIIKAEKLMQTTLPEGIMLQDFRFLNI